MPAIASPEVRDTDALIERFRCGVVVADQTQEAIDYRQAAWLGG